MNSTRQITLEELKALAPNHEIVSYRGQEAIDKVKQNGYALQYVKEQTEEICKLAVSQSGYALKYVKEQTEEICKLAISQSGYALQYVDESIFMSERDLKIQEIESTIKELQNQVSDLKKV